MLTVNKYVAVFDIPPVQARLGRKEAKEKVERAQSGSLLLHATFITGVRPPSEVYGRRVVSVPVTQVGHDDPLFRLGTPRLSFPLCLVRNVLLPLLESHYIMPRNDFH